MKKSKEPKELEKLVEKLEKKRNKLREQMSGITDYMRGKSSK